MRSWGLGWRPASHQVVWGAAVFAFVWRFPTWLWPLRPDESGFVMVARAWDPQPDSVYGTYFVDRTPVIIGLVKLSDLIGGPYFLRLVGCLGCVWLVVTLAAVAREVADGRAAAWTAVVTAALVSTTLIDPIAVKGEILGLPFIATSFWCALRALRASGGGGQGAGLWWAGAAGLCATIALGLKQNFAAGLVFGGVVLLGSWLTGRVSTAAFWRLSAAAAAGAAIPVLACVAWALAAGVHLSELWYVAFGFRSDANEVLSTQSQSAPDARMDDLRDVAFLSGMTLVLVWWLVQLPALWRRDRVITVATFAVLAIDVLGLYLGGSYWRPYLLNLVPGIGLAVATVVPLTTWRGTGMRAIAVVALLSAFWSNVVWASWQVQGLSSPDQTYAGQAIGAASEPGDTLVVFGGRADLQLASGLPSPYTHLWSLPMRTLDPDLEQLTALLAGPDAPTWFVEGVTLDSWDLPGHEALGLVLAERYDSIGEVCGEPVWLRVDADRTLVQPDCDRIWSSDGLGFLLDRQPLSE